MYISFLFGLAGSSAGNVAMPRTPEIFCSGAAFGPAECAEKTMETAAGELPTDAIGIET
jgi:hypothetical protein